MYLKWNGELKRLGFSFCIIFALLLFLANIGIIAYRNSLRQDYNAFLAAVIGNVLIAYPEVDEVSLVKMLQSDINSEDGVRLLENYGVLSGWGNKTFAGMEKKLQFMQTGLNFFGIVMFAFFGGMLIFYFGKRQRKIKGLEEYMEALDHGNYVLEIEDNADDELSGLRNEVYKLTVFLKEQASLAAEQKKALADSVADISHQLKTPLTSVMVLADNLSENSDMDEQTRKRFMGEIINQLSGMSWLVATMLKLSRLDAGVVELKRSSQRMRDLVEQALQKLETVAELRDISFAVEHETQALLFVDEKWTVEAFVNILKNALEHSPEGGRVELFCTENDVYAELRITDHGSGISEEERSRLFRRFYRGSSAKEDSVGIGLALAKEIVERQSGFIAVDSEKDKGTTFSIKFMK